MNPYGTGADGSVIISSNTTLTEDKNYVNLTINSGITLDTDGYTIYVRGTLLNNGIITSTTGAAGGAGGSGGAGGNEGTNGAAGGAGTGNGGGGGGGGGSGYDAITYTGPYVANTTGGAGGVGGVGGKAGGSVTILAKIFTNNGIIHANGSNGSVGIAGSVGEYAVAGIESTGGVDAMSGGGGGGEGGEGGSGGIVVLTYMTRTIGTVTATGGIGAGGGAEGRAGTAPGWNEGYCQANPYNDPRRGVGGSGNSGGGDGGKGEYDIFPERALPGEVGATGPNGSSGSVSWTYAVAYEDSGIRYRHGGVTYKIGYEDLEAGHKLRFRKGGVTVGLTLVATNDVDATPKRIYNGSAVKSLVKFT